MFRHVLPKTVTSQKPWSALDSAIAQCGEFHPIILQVNLLHSEFIGII